MHHHLQQQNLAVLPSNIRADRRYRFSIEAALKKYREDPRYEELRRLNGTKSMLHEDVLMILHFLAGKTRGGILELGAYLGGSTIALAKGIRRQRPFVSVEIGGAHDHPTLASKDIFADLQQNISESGVADKVRLINADSRDPKTVSAIKATMGRKRIGLFVIDSDGFVERDLELYSSLLAPDCVLVLDDYNSGDVVASLATAYPGYNNSKNNTVKPVVDRLVASGALNQFGAFGWGTWIGRTAGRQLASSSRVNTN